MSAAGSPTPLAWTRIAATGPEYADVSRWPFRDRYVLRMLADDLPHREQVRACRFFLLREPGGAAVAFGSLEASAEYQTQLELGSLRHHYIPLLAVHPDHEGIGHGKAIVRALIEIASAAREPTVAPLLVLDVYAENDRAIGLYERAGFRKLHDAPLPDPQENGRAYWIMGMRLDAAG